MPVLRDSLLLAFLGSTVLCVALGPWAIRRLQTRRWLQPLRHDDCPPLQTLQRAKQGTPTMGGLLVAGVAAAVAIGFGGLSQPEGWWVLGTILSLGAVGVLDDVLKLRASNATGLKCRPKLLAALVVGGGVGVMSSSPELGYQRVVVPWLGSSLELGWWWVPLAALIVAGSAHALNLTDGMDGLASGCLALAFGKPPVFIREGGSIGAVVSMQRHLGAPVVLMGFSLPEHGYHAPNEYFDWGQAAGGMKAFVHFFAQAGEIGAQQRR